MWYSLTHKSFAFLVHFMLNILFGLFAESVQTIFQSPACLLTSHPMSPRFTELMHSLLSYWRKETTALSMALLFKTRDSPGPCKCPIIALLFSTVHTYIPWVNLHSVSRTHWTLHWVAQTFQSGPLANGATRILSSLGHPLKVTFYSGLVKTEWSHPVSEDCTP